MIIDNSNWETISNTNDEYFILFYAPWCGHCKRVKPTWSELSHATIKVAEVDCQDNRDICMQFEIKGYPTMLRLKEVNS
jgi:thioredoxin-like negative regulator of GroEL